MADLSKVKINNVVYDLKDAAARSNIETLLGSHALGALGDAAWKAVAANISGTGLVEASVVKSYVDSAVAAIPEFDVVVVTILPEASADTFHKIYLVAQSSKAASNSYDEYITVRSGEKAAYTYSWEKVGSTDIDITGKVDKTQTICGISLETNISTDQIKTALGLKALAYKDNAATTVTDYATGIKGASYTPGGAVEVESTVVATAMTSTGSFTPAGDVSGSMTPAGTVTIARDDSGVAITGSVTAPKITITPNTTEVQHISSVGTLASYTPASYKAPSVNEAKSAFATAGLVAAIDGTDEEMLVFSAASTSNALTATGFNAGSYTAATYTPGTLPVLGEAESVMTGIASATATAPTFNGDKFAATFAGTEGDISATFTGTAGAVSVSGNYDKTTVGDATFTGTAATIAPTLETGSKTITVQ